MSVVATASGQRLRLGGILGKGGEARIHHVEGNNAIAAKIYTDGKALRRQQKINAMIADRLLDRTTIAAFPMEAVAIDGAFAGFTMRKATGAKALHTLCTPGDRKTEFPEANYRFLVRVALNLARAVATINKLGAVIGDINESIALVDKAGLVTIIDSDSFQYRSGDCTYRCLVGKPEYTPPELHGLSFEKVDRTINHDSFGLAVIIFEILFMGRHPYAGIYKGIGEPPTIAKAIAEGRFAYSPQKGETKMEPPPHVPVLTDVPFDVAEAFQKAFGRSSSSMPARPSATEWVTLLQRMEEGIIECKANSAHYYSRSAQRCPWCRFESRTSSVLFIAGQVISRSAFNLEHVLAQIEGIKGPGVAPDLVGLMPDVGRLTPSKLARDVRMRAWEKRVIGAVVAVIGIFLIANGVGYGFLIFIFACIVFFGKTDAAAPIRSQLASAEAAWTKVVDDWKRNAGSDSFDQTKRELLRKAGEYRALPGIERDMLKGLASRKFEFQKQKYLESQKLARARIEGIGDGRKMTLRSFGVETAWDIKDSKIKAVPGFGPALTENLMRWRRSVENQFVPDPHAPTDPVQITKVHAEIASRRSTMETQFIEGIRSLYAMRAEVTARRHNARQHYPVYLAFRQAERDASIL